MNSGTSESAPNVLFSYDYDLPARVRSRLRSDVPLDWIVFSIPASPKMTAEGNRLPPIPDPAVRGSGLPANVIGHAPWKVSVAGWKEAGYELDAAGEHRCFLPKEKGSSAHCAREEPIWRWSYPPPPGWRTESAPTRGPMGPPPETIRVQPPR